MLLLMDGSLGIFVHMMMNHQIVVAVECFFFLKKNAYYRSALIPLLSVLCLLLKKEKLV